jgi:16S rRNA G966 N2-methylase RsmD
MFFDLERDPKKEITEYSTVIEDRLYISTKEWDNLLHYFSEEEIKTHLSEEIKKLPFPLREYEINEVKKDWLKLKQAEIEIKNIEWENPRQVKGLDCKFSDQPLLVFGNNRGKTVSDQFTQIIRMGCGYHSSKSPIYEWENSDKKNNFLRGFFGFRSDEPYTRGGINSQTLRRAIMSHSYMAQQFRPVVAKWIYEFFDAKNVLDFSAGWGDRLVGFHASNAISYVGIDPNTKLHEKYEAISDFCNTKKKTEFICSPAEDVDLGEREFDFVFTSPPYFNIERYSEEETQSWKRYTTPEKWLEGFLFPTLTKCWKHLSEGGRMCININDKKNINLCEPMLKHMENLNAHYEGVIGYELYQRGGQKTTKPFGEPIWIWSKGVAPEPKYKTENFFGV